MNHLCPLCKTSYPSDINFCVKDGARLIAENTTADYTPPEIHNPFEPQPQNGLPYNKASIGNRFVAILIDGLIFTGLMIPAAVILVFAFIYAYGNKEGIAIMLCIIGGLLTLIPIAFQLLKDGFKNGQSPGKRTMKLMVIDLDTNMPCTRKKSCLRNVIVLLLGFVPFVGSFIEPVMVFATIDGRRLGDRTANTMVIDKSQYFN